ncbi:MAG: hypothetical protein QHJ81_14740 [Anaerolineae bacterium]|nr:hypothetical protein [Anaerolineae bacterium]
MTTLPDGIIVIVRSGGRQVFAAVAPLPQTYEQGKLMLASVVGDAVASYIQERDRRHIAELQERLEGQQLEKPAV